MAVPEEASAAIVQGQIPELTTASQSPDPEVVLRKIKELVPTYKNPFSCEQETVPTR